LIAIRGSETLTVGIGVFPLIVIRGSFIVAVLSRVRYCESVLYQVLRPVSTLDVHSHADDDLHGDVLLNFSVGHGLASVWCSLL